VLAQRVRLAGITGRGPDARGGLLDAVEVGEPLLDGQCAGSCADIALEQRQLAVPSVDARAHTPAESLGQEIDHRHQHDQQRNGQNDQALDIGRDEERKIAVQKTGPEAVVTDCIGRDRQVGRRGIGELVVAFEISVFGVQFTSCFQQQIDDGGRQSVARNEHCSGADHFDLLWRNVECKVDGSPRVASAS